MEKESKPRFVYAVIRNLNRTNKVNSKKLRGLSQKNISRDYATNLTANVHQRMMDKLGYFHAHKRRIDVFNRGQRFAFKSVHQRHEQKEFEDKMVKYLSQYGSGYYVKKRSRFDKMKYKQQINFNPRQNPLVSLQSVGDKCTRLFLAQGFEALKKDLLVREHQISQHYSDENDEEQQSNLSDQNEQKTKQSQQTEITVNSFK